MTQAEKSSVLSRMLETKLEMCALYNPDYEGWCNDRCRYKARFFGCDIDDAMAVLDDMECDE